MVTKALYTLALLLLAAAWPAANAAVYRYNWTTPANLPMPDVECGDVVVLTWPPTQTHGVFRLSDPSGYCPTEFNAEAGTQLVAPRAGGTFNYTIKNEPSFWFTDPVGTNCDDGLAIMLMTSCPEAGVLPTPMGSASTPAAHRGTPAGLTSPASPAAAAASPPAAGASPAAAHAGHSGAMTASASTLLAVALLCAALLVQRLL